MQYVSLDVIHLFLHRGIRCCQKTCTIEGVTFVEGSRILTPNYEIHHSPEYWEDPDQFIPER